MAAGWQGNLRDAPEVHRLGRVVTLGTPFFHKQWRRSRTQLHRRQNLVRIINMAGRLLIGLPGALCFGVLWCYLPTLGLSALLGLFGREAFIGVNPAAWPGWVAVVNLLCTTAFLLAVMLAAMEELRRAAEPADTNYYFDHVNCDWLRPRRAADGPAPRIPALVITAGALDEPLLALSSQPLLELFGLPVVEAFAGFRLDWRPRPPEAGVPHELEGALQNVKGALLFLRNLLLGPIMLVVRPLLQRQASRWLMDTLRQVVVSAGSGLPPHEVDDAQLVVRTHLAVGAIDEGEVWDATEYLAHQPRVDRVPVIDPQRYSFFWDPAVREARFKASRICRALSMRDRDNPLLADAEFQKHCLAVEERVLELVGGIEVLHSRYYQDPVIIAGIARFIYDGTRPGPLEPASAPPAA